MPLLSYPVKPIKRKPCNWLKSCNIVITILVLGAKNIGVELAINGDPIPDAKGVIKKIEKQLLSEVEINASFHCVGVKDSSTDFLKYLDKQKIALGSVVKVIDKEDFDDTLTVEIDGKRLTISNKIANNLYVQ